MSSVASSRAGSEQPRRAPRPSTSRTNSSSKLGQRAKKVAQQEQACCSEGGEVVLICCDSPDCVAEDIPICASDAGDIPDDCLECQQAAETGCSGDCIVQAVAASAEDCPECVEEHASDNKTSQDRSKEIRILSPSQAFSAEEPIQACDVPGCSALEWDEKAVDELLRCCCSGADHHHESFAIPSYSSAAMQTHANGTEHHHQHASSTLNSGTVAPSTSGSLPAPSQASSRAFHAHHHYHAHGHTLDAPTTMSHAFPIASNTYHQSYTSDAASGSHAPFGHHATLAHIGHTSNQASPQHFHTGDTLLSGLSSSQIGHLRSQSLPSVAAVQSILPPVQSMNATPPLAVPTFHCEWSNCSENFPSREELVGHVTVTHLLQAKASATKPTCAPPTPAHSHISSVTRLSETRDGSQSLSQVSHTAPPAASNMFPTLEQYSNTAAAQNNCNIFGNLQNQPMDPSFDHTLRCLWDSCEASLPLLGSFNGVTQQGDNLTQTADSHYHSHSNGTLDTVNMSNTQGSFQALPDQSTASLVRHLLQDHLHLPTDVLGQLSPSIAVSHSSGHTGPCITSASQPSQNGSSYMASAPVSAYSTPLSGPRASTLPSPVNHTRSPRPPAGIADEHYKFDFGLSTIPSLNAWSSRDTSMQEISQSLQPPKAEDASASHNCRWKGCRLSFDTTTELMEHISEEHIGSGKSMYYCEWDNCDRAHEGRGFNQRQKVMRHVRTHVGDKPFVCTVCGRAFSESTTMAQHMRTHTNEKPFKCPEPGCGKTFALQSALTIHLRVHTGEKPFKCPHPGCDMAFAESSNLSKHVKTHLPKGPPLSSNTTPSASGVRKRRYTSASDLEDPPYVNGSAKLLKA